VIGLVYAVAHARKRAVFALVRTPLHENIQGVHASVNAARIGACATRILIFATFTACAFAQGGQEIEPSDPWLAWKWANFAILVIGLGYLIRKYAPGFFRQRSEQIRQGIVEAAKEKQDAQARAAVIDKRLAGLNQEIETLRVAARAEIAAEGERIGQETEQRLQKIQAQTAQEIALMSRAARDQLRRYSAELAVDLARQRILSRMNQDVQNNLVDGFLEDLRHRATTEARN